MADVVIDHKGHVASRIHGLRHPAKVIHFGGGDKMQPSADARGPADREVLEVGGPRRGDVLDRLHDRAGLGVVLRVRKEAVGIARPYLPADRVIDMRRHVGRARAVFVSRDDRQRFRHRLDLRGPCIPGVGVACGPGSSELFTRIDCLRCRQRRSPATGCSLHVRRRCLHDRSAKLPVSHSRSAHEASDAPRDRVGGRRRRKRIGESDQASGVAEIFEVAVDRVQEIGVTLDVSKVHGEQHTRWLRFPDLQTH